MVYSKKRKRKLFNPKTFADLIYLGQGLVYGEYETCLFLENGNWIVQRVGSKIRLYEGINEEEAVRAYWQSVTEDK